MKKIRKKLEKLNLSYDKYSLLNSITKIYCFFLYKKKLNIY